MRNEEIRSIRRQLWLVALFLVIGTGLLSSGLRAVVAIWEEVIPIGDHPPGFTRAYIWFAAGWPIVVLAGLVLLVGTARLEWMGRRMQTLMRESDRLDERTCSRYRSAVTRWCYWIMLLLLIALIATTCLGLLAVYLPLAENHPKFG